MEARRSNFKKTVTSADGRRRRNETTRQIRKQKKDQQLLKRRNAATPLTPASSTDEMEPTGNKTTYTTSDIPMLAEMLMSTSSNSQQRLEATRGFRKILSVEHNPPVQQVLDAGVLPFLVKNLTEDVEDATLIFESAWALTNIASTTKTGAVVDANATVPLSQLLVHKNADVREQAAWCLGNIAGDNTEYRDGLLQMGVLEPLLLNVREPENASLLGNVVWTISNLCRGKPSSNFELVYPCIGPLVSLLNQELPTDILVDATWALSYLSDGPNEKIGAVMQTGVTQRLIQSVKDGNVQLLTPSLRCLGNFVTGDDQQTQHVLDAGIIDHLTELLESPKKNIRKEACWIASNIAAGTQSQIAMLMKNRNLRQALIENATNSSYEVRKEAIWTLSNIFTIGSDVQVMGLVQCDGLKPVVELLTLYNIDASVLMAALDAIEAVLTVGKRNGKNYVTLLEEYNGVEYLENLQEHPSETVYEKIFSILETFLGLEDVEDENLLPNIAESGHFAFGLSSPKDLFANEGAAPVFQFGATNRVF